MKSKLTLTNPLWQTAARRKILDKAVQQSGAELESRIKRKILDSTPAGQTYRRGAITRKANKKNLKLGLKSFETSRRVKSQKLINGGITELQKQTRVVVGYKFHRASARGQAPAVDSGGLLSSIRSKRIGFLSVRVASSKRYALNLDSRSSLNRPFFSVTVEEFKPKFKQNIIEAIRANS